MRQVSLFHHVDKPGDSESFSSRLQYPNIGLISNLVVTDPAVCFLQARLARDSELWFAELPRAGGELSLGQGHGAKGPGALWPSAR